MQNPAFTILSAVDLSLLVVWILAGRHWGNLGSWAFAAIQTAFKVHIHHLLRAITLQQTNYKPYEYKWLQTNGLTLCFDRLHHQLFSASLITKHTTYILSHCCNSMVCSAFSSVLLSRLLQPHLYSPSCRSLVLVNLIGVPDGPQLHHITTQACIYSTQAQYTHSQHLYQTFQLPTWLASDHLSWSLPWWTQ